jgi:hypothetical protein
MRLYAAMNRTYDLIRSSGAAGSASATAGSHTEALERARELHRQLTQMYNVIQDADVMPSMPAARQAEELLQEADALGEL